MASPGATQNQSSPAPVPSFDMHKFFNHPTPQPPQFPPYPTPSSSYPPPTATFPFPPQLHPHPHQIHPPPPSPPPPLAAPEDPLSQLLIQRSLSFPTPPLNPNPNPNANSNANANAGARLMALLGTPQPPPPAASSSPRALSPSPPPPLGPARLPSSKVPRGRHLMGDHVMYDVDVRVPGEVQPQLEVTPITKYGSDPQLMLGRQIAVNKSYICYGLKQGNIRVLNMNTASRSLLRGHTQRITDMTFFAEDVHLLASASTDGRICVWKISEGLEEDDKPQISGNAVIAIQVIGGEEDESVHPRVCWHCHKQEILVVGIGRRVLRIDTIKAGKSDVFSAEEPLLCAVDKLISGVQLVGLHDGVVTDLSMCQWMTSRLVSSSTDGTIKIWEDQKAQPLFVLKPHEGLPVNSATFLTSPNRPDHIVLITAGPLNQEVKVWASASEEGWLLPSDAESWKCTQTLELRSSSEAQTEDAFFNQVLVLSQAGLLLLANAKKNAIYAVHLEYGPNPASTRMDYLAEFTVTMPILSFTGTTDISPFGEQIVQVYCVQTQAIQQYALDLFLCMPPSLENAGLEKSDSMAPCDVTNIEGSAAVDSSQMKPNGISSTGSATNFSEKIVSSDAAHAASYPVSAATEVLGTRQITILNTEPRTSAMGRAVSDTNIVSTASPPPLPLSPRLSRQASGLRSPSTFEPAFLLSDHSRNQAITDFSVQRVSSGDMSHGPSSDNGLRSRDDKVSEEETHSLRNPPAAFKHPTHLITPSEILGAAPSSGTNDIMRGKSDVEKSIQDVGVNNEVCNVEVEVKVVPDGSSRREKFSPEESRESIADNNEKFFCSQASDLGNQIARECLAGSSAGQSQQTNDAEVTERSTQLPCSDEVNASSNVTEEVSYQTVTSQALASATAKIKRQKGKNTQAMAPSPSPSTFNSADSSSEAVISSSLHSIEAAVPQIMHEKLNQIMAMQKEMKKQMTATINVPVTKEGRRLETSLARTMEKIVKANSDALWARFQEENVKNEKLLQDRVQQIINVLGNLINKDLPATIERIVKREVAAVQTNVLRAITPAIEKTIVSAITESFQKGVGDKAINQLEKSVNSKLEASVARQIVAQFQTSGRQALQDAVKSSMVTSMVPAFEKSCRAMFEQIDATFQRGMTEHTSAAMQHVENANSPLTHALRDVINSASSMTHTLNGELAEAQRKLVCLAVGGANPSAISPLLTQPSSGPLGKLHEKVDIPIDPRKELSRLISECKYEEAFASSLQRSDVSIVSWLCSQVDLRAVLGMAPLPLSQGVLLSLLQQLACDINNDPPRKLSWMTDVAGVINPSDPIIAVHVRPIFEQVYQILNHQRSVPTLGGSELSTVRLLMHVINSMIMTCK
ncbi:enhancer of mRNA-decapping protein 4-like isoform X2 [Punica granatum]|uniref:Enhancer of mRNA-decapping protein 4-like isoform X2 n=1 Tax=Punica granatum TaxID=22663 RepID=A0A6P8E9Q8_PUNGR|nr:enhancer of mRNA-decapping protein 4-like isoform X2 [Punica granatum]